MRHLPNLLTLSRLVLTPLVVLAILNGAFGRALAIMAVAGITDMLDGILARALNARSRTGAYLDPIADKFLLSSSYVALGLAAVVPWWLVGIIFGRDLLILLMAGAALLFTPIRDFPPSKWGKLSTVVQVVTAVALIAERAMPIGRWVEHLVWAAALATGWSGLDYVRQGVARLAALRKA